MRSYMEIDPEAFEKLTTQAQNEDKNKTLRGKENEGKWAKLEQKMKLK